MAIKFNILIILILLEGAIYCAGLSYPQLKLVSVIFRHGDREPNHSVTGALTNAGRQRAYHLGEMLRARYGDFLGEIYEPSSLSARSTQYVRAQLSLQLTLAGLYKPQGNQRWHKSLDWQPIPFSYVPVEEDYLLIATSCPRFMKERSRVFLLPEFQKLLEPYQDMLKNVTASTGKEVKTAYDMFLLYHNLSAMKSMNESIPTWAEPYFSNGLLLNGTFLQYRLLRFTNWMQKMNGGTVLRKIVDDMLNKTDVKSVSKQKLFLYSTHEMTMVATLQILKLWYPHIPQYSSAVAIELREDRGNYYVKVLYYLGIPDLFREMQIPGCPVLCPLPRFIELISDQLPDYSEIICDDKPVQFLS